MNENVSAEIEATPLDQRYGGGFWEFKDRV